MSAGGVASPPPSPTGMPTGAQSEGRARARNDPRVIKEAVWYCMYQHKISALKCIYIWPLLLSQYVRFIHIDR